MSRQARAAWLAFPRRAVYPSTSAWVPPLERDLARMLDRRRNPFFRHGDGVPLLAVDGAGRPVGRILAHVYRRHRAAHGERAAFFGYFECRDDPVAVRALVRAAARFGLRHGCDVLRGPFNMTAMQEMGTLVEGFDAPPAVDETYTAPYYPRLLAAAGLRPVFPHATYRVDDLARVDPNALLGEHRLALLADAGVRIRRADPRRLDRELETLRRLLNDSFADNPHFVPITPEEFEFQVGPYRAFLDPRICLVAELDGAPRGFVMCAADFNPILKLLGGRIGPLALARALPAYLRWRGHRDACLIIMGVERAYQGRGIMRALLGRLVAALRAGGYRALTVTWISEQNRASRASILALGARPYHRLTLHEAPIPSLLTT